MLRLFVYTKNWITVTKYEHNVIVDVNLQCSYKVHEIKAWIRRIGRGENKIMKICFQEFKDEDNYAMRCVFHKCGFVKEAHHRKAWVGQDGRPYDAIGYGITKEDWRNGKTTPVNWNDFKC